MRVGERNAVFAVFAMGTLTLSGISLQAQAEHAGSLAAFVAARSSVADAGQSDRIMAVAGMWLPTCRLSDPRGPYDLMFAQHAADPSAPSRLPVRSTLPAGMTAPALADRPRSPVPADGDAVRHTGRPRAIVPLYLAMTSLQSLDIVSTRRALSAGAREANPIVAPIVRSQASVIALKAGASGAIIYAVERMWKQNRTAAILTLIGTNIGYGLLVAHNFALAGDGAGAQ
jgi:hypothetical protein